MEYTGIRKEKEGYMPHKDNKELIRDEKTIKISRHTTDGNTANVLEPEADFSKALEGVVGLMNKAQKLQEENKELREQNDFLQQKVSKLQNDELCQVVNLDTIVKYALRQTNSKTVQTIVNMLSRLCIGKGCIPEPLQMKIEDLENHIIALQSPRPVNHHNHGCQNFYGNISESDFRS